VGFVDSLGLIDEPKAILRLGFDDGPWDDLASVLSEPFQSQKVFALGLCESVCEIGHSDGRFLFAVGGAGLDNSRGGQSFPLE